MGFVLTKDEIERPFYDQEHSIFSGQNAGGGQWRWGEGKWGCLLSRAVAALVRRCKQKIKQSI